MWLPSWLLTEKLLIVVVIYTHESSQRERERAQGQTGKVGMMMEEGLWDGAHNTTMLIYLGLDKM